MVMKDVIISIKGLQGYGEDNDAIELVTDGKYGYSDEQCKLIYMESELTGLEGTKTSFTIEPTSMVLEREGTLNSRMVFEQGKKHTFLYDTPFGAATMAVDTKRVFTKLDERGGDMEVDYIINLEHAAVGRNKLRIKVREINS